jgi:hypothetical protein
MSIYNGSRLGLQLSLNSPLLVLQFNNLYWVYDTNIYTRGAHQAFPPNYTSGV